MFLQSLLIGILYFFCRWNPFYTSWLEASCTPMFLSVIIGFIMGDVTSAVIVGAYVQTVYLGLIPGLGSVATVDKSLGSCIIIPLAVASGMSPELAVSMAIPFGLLGTLTINLSKVFSSFAASRCDKAAEEGNAAKLRRIHLGYATGFWSIFGIIPVTLINYFGPSAVTSMDGGNPWTMVCSGRTAQRTGHTGYQSLLQHEGSRRRSEWRRQFSLQNKPPHRRFFKAASDGSH